MIEQEELLADFIDEALLHFQSIEPDLLELEKDGDQADQELVNRLFRGIHSIKGAAGFFGLNNINHLSHTMENLLTLVREKEISIGSELVDALLEGSDILRSLIEDVGQSDQVDISQITKRLQHCTSGSDDSDQSVELFELLENGGKGRSFVLPEEQIKRFVKGGNELYSVDVFLNRDIADQQKTPFDFVNNMALIGEFIKTSFSYDQIDGLANCLDNELSVTYIFATILELGLVPTALEIPASQVKSINLNAYKKQKDEILKKDVKPQLQQVQKGTGGEIEISPTEKSLLKEKATTTQSKSASGRQIEAEEKIRVGISVMNDLMNLAGELVLGRNQLMRKALPLVKDVQGLNPVLQHISRITTEMQGKIMQMRMQPVSMLFSKFHRVVRELSKKLGKEIRLITYGEDVELDKTIIEALSDPLTHLVRNCCDHAIELPDEREKIGKPRVGTIELKAYHQAGQVHLEISDDGVGVNGQRIAEKALEKNIITEAEILEMSDQEKARLILKPGFSTAEEVSDISGRGVGMDVVNTNISQLGGNLTIDTKIGFGTRLGLELPLTLAIVSGLVTRVGSQTYIVPEVNIEELVRIKPEEVEQRINRVHDARVLRLRDKLLPLIDLKSTLNVSETSSDSELETSIDEPIRILIVRHGSSVVGLLVDRLENFEEIVVKPLPRYLKELQSYSGVSIMGNGKVSLILDVAGLIKKANLNIKEDLSEQNHLGRGDSKEEEELQTMLLFDNYTDEKYALPLELITRIEKVSVADIERVDDKTYMQYQGKELRLISLEDYLPVQKPERAEDRSIGVLIPKQMKQDLGVIVGRIYGTVNEVVNLDTKNIQSPGLFGSAVLDGKITLLPDLFKLVEMVSFGQHAESSARTSDRKRVILLVDDTPFFRMIETEYLESSGYEVIIAENGQKCLEMLEKHHVDAVILDIIMPEMDGFQTIQAIRSDEKYGRLPVMAVTSMNDDQSRDKGLSLGFTEWESKLDKAKLIEKLDKIVL